MTGAGRICAVTGSNGYIGRRLVSWLSGRGWVVRRLSRAGGDARFVLGEPMAPGVLDGVDALIHCAYDFADLRPAEAGGVNGIGTRDLLNAANIAGVRRTIFISSISAFPGCRSHYGKSKLASEADALSAGALVVRPGLVYGAGGGLVAAMQRMMRRLPVVPLIGDGSWVSYTVQIDDLCAMLEGTLNAAEPPRLVTAAHPQAWPFRALLETAAGRPVRFVAIPWRALWGALRLVEASGIRPPFRSDSITGLVFPNPAPAIGLSELRGFPLGLVEGI